MEQRHRDIIQQNFTRILNATNLDYLLPKLESKNIFPEILLQQFKLPDLTELERKRRIFLNIQKRGPTAFAKLLEACLESGHKDLYNILVSNKNTSTDGQKLNKMEQPPTSATQINDNSQIDSVDRSARPFHHPRQFSNDLRETLEENTSEGLVVSYVEEALQINVKPSIEWMDIPTKIGIPPYSMRSRIRGAALIINNKTFYKNLHEERRGADVDERNLKELFTQLNFVYRYHENQTLADMLRVLKHFTTQDEILSEVDCCFVMILSHGKEGASQESSEIVTYDDCTLSTFEIQNMFSNTMCPRMQNKPKVLIFQICRGPLLDYGTREYTKPEGKHMLRMRTFTDGGHVNAQRERNIPVVSDMLVCHTAYPGYKSHRDFYLGSWFVECFCKVFMERAHDTDVYDMLRYVSMEINKKRSEKDTTQVTPILTIQFRPCYLNPGLPKLDENKN